MAIEVTVGPPQITINRGKVLSCDGESHVEHGLPPHDSTRQPLPVIEQRA